MSLTILMQVGYCQVMVRQTDDVRTDGTYPSFDVFPQPHALANQIDDIDVMTRIRLLAPILGDAEVGHVKGRFVHDHRSHIRH